MKKVVKKLVSESLGKIGDRANSKYCALLFYQPKSCKRGESVSKMKESE